MMSVSTSLRRPAGAGRTTITAMAVALWATVYPPPAATASTPLPPLMLKQLDGGSIDFAKIKGKPLVINLWATWCPSCRHEMPMMAEIAASTDKVTFLFVNQGEDVAKIRAFFDAENIKLRHVVLDPGSQVARHYGARGLPMTLFIGADGLSRVAYMGEISREALSKYVARLLGER